MSQENAETVRRVLDAFNRGDPKAVLDDLAPDYKHDLSRAVGPWHGQGWNEALEAAGLTE